MKKILLALMLGALITFSYETPDPEGADIPEVEILNLAASFNP